MNRQKTRFFCFLLLLLFLLTGCRRRLGSTRMDSEAGIAGSEQTGSGVRDTGDEKLQDLPDNSDEQITETSGDDLTESELTRENPDSRRREYDDSADTEIQAGKPERLQDSGEGEGFFAYADDALSAVIRVDETAQRQAVQTSWVDHSERMSAAEAGEMAEGALQYYSVLLAERTGSLFECKKLYAYLEMPEAFTTIYKGSQMHSFLVNTGMYDVASRLRENDLTVDAGWVVRKNPDMIVKTVSAAVLGHDVQIASHAEQILSQLLARPEWNKTAAVQKNRVFLVSEEIFESPYLWCAGQLYLAKKAYPELFEDVDLMEALRMLIDESGGSAFSGTYFYDAQGGISI